MTRIIFAAVITMVSLSIAAMTTWAAWTSTVTVNNNLITTGSVNLNVSLDNSTYSKSVSSSQSITSLMPGNGRMSTVFYVRNDSSTGINFNLGGTGVVSISGITPPANLNSLQLAIVRHNVVPVNADYRTITQWASTQSLGALNAGANQSFDLYARLESIAADDWQGRSVNFVISVTGTQL